MQSQWDGLETFMDAEDEPLVEAAEMCESRLCAVCMFTGGFMIM